MVCVPCLASASLLIAVTEIGTSIRRSDLGHRDQTLLAPAGGDDDHAVVIGRSLYHAGFRDGVGIHVLRMGGRRGKRGGDDESASGRVAQLGPKHPVISQETFVIDAFNIET